MEAPKGATGKLIVAAVAVAVVVLIGVVESNKSNKDTGSTSTTTGTPESNASVGRTVQPRGISKERRDTLISVIQEKSGVSRGCAEQVLDRGLNPANYSRRVGDLGFTKDCLQELARSVQKARLAKLAKAFNLTTEDLEVFFGVLRNIKPDEIEREAESIRQAGQDNLLGRLFDLQTEKAIRDCSAVKGAAKCQTGEELGPYRDRLVLFLVDGKEVWLNPNDEGFRTARPFSGSHQQERARILAELGDYRETAIWLAENHIKGTAYLYSLEPDFDAIKWSAVDNKRWCDGCWMVWCELKAGKRQENGMDYIVHAYWEVNVKTNTIRAVSGTPTDMFFAIRD